jgi:hypothetical protein
MVGRGEHPAQPPAAASARDRPGLRSDTERMVSALRRPVVANGQAEVVRLSGCLTEQGEIPHFGRSAPLHFLLHAGVGHHEMPIVEYVMADETIEEFLHLCAELWGLPIQLRQVRARSRSR